MMSNLNQNSGALPLDNEKLYRMKIKIVKLEKDNLITNALNKSQMLEAIKRIIIEEENKCY